MLIKIRYVLGFSLLELMLAISIVAILSSIAYPSYREHVARARRSEAQSAVMAIAQFMEKNYTATGSYILSTSGGVTTLPFYSIPKDSSNPYYIISLSNVTSSAFTVVATRAGTMNGDYCGDFTLDYTGVKSIKNAGSGVLISQCW